MKIELKSLKIYDGMSEETIAFTADIFVNGKKVAHAKNDGNGGSSYYTRYQNADRTLLVAAEDYCKGLPPKKYESNGSVIEIKQTLEDVIEGLVNEAYNEKEKKKFEKKLNNSMIKGLCHGDVNSFTITTWTGYTIPQLLALPHGRALIRAKLLQLKSENRPVLNTNIPKELFG